MNRNQPQRTFKMGGGVKSFQHINEQQAPTALSQRSLFLCQICTRKHFQPYCIIWPKTFFSPPILLSHMQQNTHERKTEFERRWGVIPEEYGQECPGPSPLRKIRTQGTQEIVSIPPELTTESLSSRLCLEILHHR